MNHTEHVVHVVRYVPQARVEGPLRDERRAVAEPDAVAMCRRRRARRRGRRRPAALAAPADQRDGTRSRTDRIPPSCVAQGPSREAPVACVLLLVLVQLPLASRAYTPCRSARTGLGTGLATVIAGLLYRPRRPRFPTRPALPGSHHGERGHGHAFLWS